MGAGGGQGGGGQWVKNEDGYNRIIIIIINNNKINYVLKWIVLSGYVIQFDAPYNYVDLISGRVHSI